MTRFLVGGFRRIILGVCALGVAVFFFGILLDVVGRDLLRRIVFFAEKESNSATSSLDNFKSTFANASISSLALPARDRLRCFGTSAVLTAALAGLGRIGELRCLLT